VLVDPARPAEKNWRNILPEGKDKLDDVKIIGGKIIAVYIKDASHRLRVFDMKGKFENEIMLPALGKIDEFEGKRNDKSMFYTFTSFTYPSTVYQYDIKTKKSVVHHQPTVDFNPDDYLTEQKFYSSKDSTKVPMFIVRKKDVELSGDNAAWLYGYGGFNNAILPDFKPMRIAWLEQGGIYVLANIRGGSEYGERWHEQGMKLKKQNVFDDFIAAAEYLIANKYTNSQKLAIEGRSNGGLLIGAVINQRPELFRVAFPAVGVMDMLRFHKFTIGWAWVGDYGSSDNPAEFQYLYKYSPLQNIREDIN
jgi:prolyl oligopeptidase